MKWLRWLFYIRPMPSLPVPHWSTVVHNVGTRRFEAGVTR